MLSLTLSDFHLLVLVVPHTLDRFEGNQARNSDLHSVRVPFDKVLFADVIGFRHTLQFFSYKVYLVAKEVVAEEALNDEIPFDEIDEVFDELFVVFDRDFPEVDAGGEEGAETLFHLIEGLAVGLHVKLFDRGMIGIS